jgi:hypothetical protein
MKPAMNGAAVGKHRRREADLLLAVQQYELLVLALRAHRPGERSGLCLACGVGWPCTDVWLPLVAGACGEHASTRSSIACPENY